MRPDGCGEQLAIAKHYRVRLRRKDGDIIYVSLNASAVGDQEGNITHSRSAWRDVAECKRTEETVSVK